MATKKKAEEVQSENSVKQSITIANTSTVGRTIVIGKKFYNLKPLQFITFYGNEAEEVQKQMKSRTYQNFIDNKFLTVTLSGLKMDENQLDPQKVEKEKVETIEPPKELTTAVKVGDIEAHTAQAAKVIGSVEI